MAKERKKEQDRLEQERKDKKMMMQTLKSKGAVGPAPSSAGGVVGSTSRGDDNVEEDPLAAAERRRAEYLENKGKLFKEKTDERKKNQEIKLVEKEKVAISEVKKITPVDGPPVLPVRQHAATAVKSTLPSHSLHSAPIVPTATTFSSSSAAPPLPVKDVEPKYTISDHGVSSDDLDSEEEEEKKNPKHNVPSWAKGEHLHNALARQFGRNTYVDPDQIFPQVTTINLDGAILF
jgi:hypothetical protein